MGGWDSKQRMVGIYSSRQKAESAIKATGCTKRRDGKWTREPVEGEHLSDITSYIVSNSLPFDAKLKTKKRKSVRAARS
jgi:hypothetical protein